MQHYQGIRKSPNCRWVFNAGSGLNRGSLQLIASTRNGAGIAAGAEVCANYGCGFSFDVALPADAEESPLKRFKGALDFMFSKSDKEPADATAMEVDTPARAIG